MRVPGLSCLTLLLGLGCEPPAAPEVPPDLASALDELTVVEARNQRAMLSGKRVRVRGFGRLLVSTTLKGCSPMRCDCNTSTGSFSLSNLRKPDIFQDFHLYIPELSCAGDECTAVCSPFDPRALGYELLGTFTLQAGDRMTLTGLDLSASYQLMGEGELHALARAPLVLGDITIKVTK